MDTTRKTTRLFLIVLRLVIGWQFFIEGWDKINSDTWTSAGYLRQSVGPLAPIFRDLAGDKLIEQVRPSYDKNSDKYSLSPELKNSWDVYFEAFTSHYELTEEQTKKAEKIFNKHQTVLLNWLRIGEEKVVVPSAQDPPLAVYWTMEKRGNEYRRRLDQVRQLERELPEYGTAMFAEYSKAKTYANILRAGMQRDLAKRTGEMKADLQSVLTKEQLELPILKNTWHQISNFSNWSLLDWSDFVVKWGLAITGICLLAGLFTRLACVAGATFLLLFFLAIPPLPWLPSPPNTEGHYIYFNKNMIEMFALLALASTHSGRWLGIDGLVQFLWARPQKAAPEQTTPTQEKIEPPPVEQPKGKAVLETPQHPIDETAIRPLNAPPKENT